MQFRLLGPLEVEDDGEPLRIAGAKQRALLGALLLRANRPVSRERLIEELWGESAPPSAAHRLEEHVSRLRRLLHRNGAAPLETQPGGYILRAADGAVDAQQFAQLVAQAEKTSLGNATTLLREALRLWRGPPLEDATLNGSFLSELRLLEEQRFAAEERLMAVELARGRDAHVLPELEALVQHEPLRERRHFLLMLALYRSGRQAHALAAYQRARRTLTQELGIEPTRELKELEQAILKQDSSLERFEVDGPLAAESHQATPGNLPRPATSFVGREREIADVLELLAQGSRLVTLTGPGGSGKTRLALEAAYRAGGAFPDGVFWVALAPLQEPELVLSAVSQTLGAVDNLAAHIGAQRLLLVIDNFEQVSAAAPDVVRLVTACPDLYVLVTSRELLRVTAESVYKVPVLTESEAVELFCARSRAQPDEFVAGLCRRLDYLPLALEFAAARTAILSPRQILERMSHRLDLLKGPPDVESRQATLRATIEWSHELLCEEEQDLFARIAVFAGGFTIEAAEEICGADVDTLQSLVEKSLVQHEGERFSLLETVRDFGLQRLIESGGDDCVRQRHLAFFTNIAEQSARGLRASDASRSSAVLGAEVDNIRAALSFARDTDAGPFVLRIAGALGRNFWSESAHRHEGRTWLERGLAMSDNPAEARIQALLGLVVIAEVEGDVDRGRRHAREMLSLAQACDDAEGLFYACLNLGILSDGPRESEAWFGEAARVAKSHEAEFSELSGEEALAIIAVNLSAERLRAGAYSIALALAEEGAGKLERIPIAQVKAMANAGAAARELGRLDEASAWFIRGLGLAAQLGVSAIHEIGGLAAIELARGRLERASCLAGAADALCERGFVFEGFERAVHERTLHELSTRLGDETLARALAAGRAMTLDEMLAYAGDAPV